MNDKNKTEDIPHQVVPTTAASVSLPAKVLTVEEKIAIEVEKFSLPRAAIAKMKEEYLPILEMDLTDKANYKKLANAVTDLRTKRTGVGKKYKELNADALAFSRGLKKEADELEELIREIEDPLKVKKDDIDNAEEKRKESEEQQRQQILQGRVATLLENGMVYNGTYYAIGDSITQDVVTIKTMTDDQYDGLLERVKTVNAGILETKRLADEKAEADRQEVERQRLENERIQNEQKEAQAELQRGRDELAKQQEEMKKQTLQLRCQKLEGIGFIRTMGESMKIKIPTQKHESFSSEITISVIRDASPEIWDKLFNEQEREICLNREKEATYLQQLKDEQAAEVKRKHDAELLDQRTKARALQLYDKFLMRLLPRTEGYNRHSEYEGVMTLFLNQKHVVEKTDEQWPDVIADLEKTLKLILIEERHKQEIIDADAAQQEAEENKRNEAQRLSTMNDAQKMLEFTTKAMALAYNNSPVFPEESEFYQDVESLKEFVTKLHDRANEFVTGQATEKEVAF